TIEPATEFVSGEQPSVVDGPAAFAGSRPRTTGPARPGEASAGPKAAAPTLNGPAIEAGAVTCRSGVPAASVVGTAALTAGPSQATRRVRTMEAARCPSVIVPQCRPVVSSRM